MAVLFAREGARVIVADINKESGEETVRQLQAGNGLAIFVQVDVTEDNSVQEMVARLTDSYNRVDILVNNAGANVVGGVLSLPLDRWEKGVELNLTSVYRCCQFVVPEIIKAGGGSVIIMASVQGIAGFWESSAYAAAKGGLISLTRQLACDLANQRVRVNSISPGVILTPIFNSIEGKDTMFKTVSEHAPLGHIGVPEDVAFAAVFLASDESSYITGTNLVIDGGMTMRGV